MARKPTILAIIGARGGSRGVPGKNILQISGKPLLAWTIEAAQASKFISSIIVSTDDDKIINVAKQYEVEVLKRPLKLATDKSPAVPFMLHAIKNFQKNHNYLPNIIMLLQPTSPLRTGKHIDEAISLMFKKKADAVLSVKKIDKQHLKTFLVKKDYLTPAVNKNFPFMSRQLLPEIYTSNGAIYGMYTKKFIKIKKLFTAKTVPYLMDYDSSMDLDYPEEIPLIERLLAKIKTPI